MMKQYYEDLANYVQSIQSQIFLATEAQEAQMLYESLQRLVAQIQQQLKEVILHGC